MMHFKMLFVLFVFHIGSAMGASIHGAKVFMLRLRHADGLFLQEFWGDVRLGGMPITDVHDTYLWRFVEFTQHGQKKVQLQNVHTGKWMCVSPWGKITCDREWTRSWETFNIKYLDGTEKHDKWGPLQPDAHGHARVWLQAVSNSKYIGRNCQGCSPYLQCHQTDPWGWETFDLIPALAEPRGEWVPVGTASSPEDLYSFHVEYSNQLEESSTASLSNAFSMQVGASYGFGKMQISGSASKSMSSTVSQTFKHKRGATFVKKCPKSVCDGHRLAKYYQWKMSADLNWCKKAPLSVMTYGTAVFAWSPPKCSWTTCKDVQCQTCMTARRLTPLRLNATIV